MQSDAVSSNQTLCSEFYKTMLTTSTLHYCVPILAELQMVLTLQPVWAWTQDFQVSGGVWNENLLAVDSFRSLEPKSVPLTLYSSSMHVGIQGLPCKTLHFKRCPILFTLPVSVFNVVVYVVYIVCIYIPINSSQMYIVKCCSVSV